MADIEEDSRFTFPAEILPENERTAEILKKRAEIEEQRRQKQDEMKLLRDQEEKKKKKKE
jgi:hypothetical protein